MFLVLLVFLLLNVSLTVRLFRVASRVLLSVQRTEDRLYNIEFELVCDIHRDLLATRAGLESSIHALGSAWVPAAVIGGGGDSNAELAPQFALVPV